MSASRISVVYNNAPCRHHLLPRLGGRLAGTFLHCNDAQALGLKDGAGNAP